MIKNKKFQDKGYINTGKIKENNKEWGKKRNNESNLS